MVSSSFRCLVPDNMLRGLMVLALLFTASSVMQASAQQGTTSGGGRGSNDSGAGGVASSDDSSSSSNVKESDNSGDVGLKETFNWIKQKLTAENPVYREAVFGGCQLPSGCQPAFNMAVSREYGAFESDGCKLSFVFGESSTLSSALTGASQPKSLTGYLVKIDFSAANPQGFLVKELSTDFPDPAVKNQYTPPQWALRLKDPAAQLFRAHRDPNASEDVWEKSGLQLQIIVTSREIATRIAKAFTHASALCGGLKKEPF